MAVLGSCDAKVHDFDVAIRLDHYVLGFNVSVDNIMFMGNRKRLRNLAAYLGDLFAVKGPMFADAAL